MRAVRSWQGIRQKALAEPVSSATAAESWVAVFMVANVRWKRGGKGVKRRVFFGGGVVCCPQLTRSRQNSRACGSALAVSRAAGVSREVSRRQAKECDGGQSNRQSIASGRWCKRSDRSINVEKE